MQQHAIETTDPRAIGRRLQEARKARGFTQREVAESLGVARTTITALEKGERRPRPVELITMARLYGRSVRRLRWSKGACARFRGAVPHGSEQHDLSR